MGHDEIAREQAKLPLVKGNEGKIEKKSAGRPPKDPKKRKKPKSRKIHNLYHALDYRGFNVMEQIIKTYHELELPQQKAAFLRAMFPYCFLRVDGAQTVVDNAVQINLPTTAKDLQDAIAKDPFITVQTTAKELDDNGEPK